MAIKQAGSLNSVLVALLVALGFALTPAESLAQPDGDDAADSDDDDAAGDDDDDAAGDDDDDDDGPVAGDDDDDGGGEEPVGLDALCELDPDNCVRLNMEEYAARDVDAEMYAVQQIWALRKYRFELNPYFGATMNDQFVSHPAMGLGANFYVLDPLAIGVNGNFYQPFNSESDFNFQTSRAARVGQPLTEYSFNVNGNITYVPAYGKFAAFGGVALTLFERPCHLPLRLLLPDRRRHHLDPSDRGRRPRQPDLQVQDPAHVGLWRWDAHLLHSLAGGDAGDPRLHVPR